MWKLKIKRMEVKLPQFNNDGDLDDAYEAYWDSMFEQRWPSAPPEDPDGAENDFSASPGEG